MKIESRFSCDIFCHVVDNFGDIGVTWRLASQLAHEFGIAVRLVVDDLPSLQKLVPSTDLLVGEQIVQGVGVYRWELSGKLTPAALVIEAFGCALPSQYRDAMAASLARPVWLNLEYLSAEAWISTHHLLPSIQPTTGCRKYFFFPGFGEGTGGLIREHGLLIRRNEYIRLNPQCSVAELKIFIFGYENAALSALLRALENRTIGGRKAVCSISPGALASAAQRSDAAIQVQFIDFVEQSRFDELLWSHDFLFVRGEDSFVRAQWAGKPFIWQIYPQEEGAHLSKLNAFLDIYCTHLTTPAAVALRKFSLDWNAQDATEIGDAWNNLATHINELEHHAKCWAEKLANRADLATNMVTFYEKTAKI